MSSANLLTIGFVALFIHSIVALVFSKLIIYEEPQWNRRLVLFILLWLLPLVGAVFVFKALHLNWFRNEDGSNRTGGIAFSFLELDAVFNPGAKEVLEEQRRTKVETRKHGKLKEDDASK